MNDHDTVNRLVTQNFGLAHFWAGQYAKRLGYNDALSVAMAGLLVAAQRWDQGHGCPFGTYASYRIKAEYSRVIRAEECKKRGGEFAHCSLDAPVRAESSMTLAQVIKDDNARHGHNVMTEHERQDELQQLLTLLTPRDREILSLRYGLDGGGERKLREIAAIYGITTEAVRLVEAKALRIFWRAKNRKKVVLTAEDDWQRVA